MTAVVSTSGGCGDTDAKSTPVLTKLRADTSALSTIERLQQTLDYVRAPQDYLKATLGEEVFNSRKHLFCLASSYDKDIYGSGGHKAEFQKCIAQQLGKTLALFFITGVQAQLVALKIHCDNKRNNRVAWHVSSHLESAEERAYTQLYQLDRSLLGSHPERQPSVEEIATAIRQDKPAVVLLELPNRMLGCTTYTYAELKQIADICHEHDTILHLDGARLWEIMPYYEQQGKTINDITSLFDTVYVSFYKGLGGITGAMLLTDDETTFSNAQMWQRRAGGNPLTMVYETIDCERGYNENIGTFTTKWEKTVELVTAMQEATAVYKNADGSQIISFQQTTCCQTKTSFHGYTSSQLCQARDHVQTKTGIRVFDNLWQKHTLDDKLAADRAGESLGNDENDTHHEVEWMVVDATLSIDKSLFVQGYVALCQELQASPAT